ncbi:hypothetical protein P152DRAFT_442213 [Eremomyces bilateralis CBS 781.70]|uniref:Maintenance of mitochondrial morphology protein 1 n=1 Tax=Eremomyces bilateralis CBS 781.70 TaxID=1392243 RepID=A0A6G1FTS4_9PEZI|nr:uncharacterized protein P152DRAFT_442213 [Eremomyces bilateralis CBS 781.70]KAF1809285.1 hypothetical protein P152DRAFT_442213 [Eremomyces bilateralis CBS 781.70]
MPESSSFVPTFTQGFILGQLTLAVIIFAFIKFFIFGEPSTSDSLRPSHRPYSSSHSRTYSRSASGGANNTLRHRPSTTFSTLPPSTPLILSKTYYNTASHPPESLDWFNVLVAQTLAQLRADALHEGAIVRSLESVLNGPLKPSWVGDMRITEIALGEEFPIFSNCRVIPVEEGENGHVGMGVSAGEGARLQAQMDVDLGDVITLGVETTVRLNYPKPLIAVLPVALAVSVVRFSGTLSLSLPSSPTRNSTALTFTFHPNYTLALRTSSLVGSRARLTNLPKLAELIEAQVRRWFEDRVVSPRFQQVALPSLWPRMRNARGGEPDDSDDRQSTAPEETARESRSDSKMRGRDRSRGHRRPSTAQGENHAAPDHDHLRTSSSARDPNADDIEHRAPDEGLRLRDSEARSRDADEGLRFRSAGSRSRESEMRATTDGFKIPGSMPGGLVG